MKRIAIHLIAALMAVSTLVSCNKIGTGTTSGLAGSWILDKSDPVEIIFKTKTGETLLGGYTISDEEVIEAISSMLDESLLYKTCFKIDDSEIENMIDIKIYQEYTEGVFTYADDIVASGHYQDSSLDLQVSFYDEGSEYFTAKSILTVMPAGNSLDIAFAKEDILKLFSELLYSPIFDIDPVDDIDIILICNAIMENLEEIGLTAVAVPFSGKLEE